MASNPLIVAQLKKQTEQAKQPPQSPLSGGSNNNAIVQSGLTRDERHSLENRQAEAQAKRESVARIKAGSDEALYRKNTIADSARVGMAETFSGANANGNKTDFDYAYQAGGLRAVDDQVAQGKIAPQFGVEQNGAINYRYGAEVTTDERDFYAEQIAQLRAENAATERRRQEESKNYKASTARIEATNKSGFADLERDFGNEIAGLKNLFGDSQNLGGDFESSFASLPDEGKSYIQEILGMNIPEEEKRGEIAKVMNGNTLTPTLSQWGEGANARLSYQTTGQGFGSVLNGLWQADASIAREQGKNGLLVQMKQQMQGNELFQNNAMANAKVALLQKQVEDTNRFEEMYNAYFASVQNAETAKAEREKERSMAVIQAEKEKILAEKDSTMANMREKRSRLEGFLKAKYANYGMLDSSYGLNSLSRNIGAFEAQVEGIEAQYENQIRDLNLKQMDVLNEYDDTVTDSFLKYQKNILDTSINSEKERNTLAFKAFEVKEEADKRNNTMLRDILGGVQKAEAEWRADQERAEKEAMQKMEKEAQLFSEHTGMIHTVKDGQVVPLLKNDGKPLMDWGRQQQKAKLLMSFTDLPARAEDFSRWQAETQMALTTAYQSGMIDENELRSIATQLEGVQQKEIYQQKVGAVQQFANKTYNTGNAFKYPQADTQVFQDGTVLFGKPKTINGDFRGQCGEYVNDMMGFTEGNGKKLRNSYESKLAKVTSETPVVGGFFVQKTSQKWGHTGLVEKVWESNGVQKMQIAHQNWRGQEKFLRETLTLKNGKWVDENGQVRNITGYGEPAVRTKQPTQSTVSESSNLDPVAKYALEQGLTPEEFTKEFGKQYSTTSNIRSGIINEYSSAYIAQQKERDDKNQFSSFWENQFGGIRDKALGGYNTERRPIQGPQLPAERNDEQEQSNASQKLNNMLFGN